MITAQVLSSCTPGNLASVGPAVVGSREPIDRDQLPVTESDEVNVEVQKILGRFMRQCGLSALSIPPYDKELHNSAWEEARQRGYFTGDESIDHVFGRCLNLGIAIAYTTFGHLQNQRIKVLVALTTALLSYVDDVFQDDVGQITHFHELFCRGQPQGHPILDSLAHCLLDFRNHFDTPIADLMLTCCLDYMAAQFLEFGILTEKMPICARSFNFSSFVRFLSGALWFYVLAIFPPEVPLHSYIQAVPDLIQYCNYTNDVLSFYKEEMAGEEANYVTNMAACLETSKTDALQRLAEDTAGAATCALRIVSGRPVAYEAVQAFIRGYVMFHLASPRYKLTELFVCRRDSVE